MNNKTNENKIMAKNVIKINEQQLKNIIAESIKELVKEDAQFMSDDSIRNQYSKMKITYFAMHPLRRSEGWEGTFELEFPNADGVDFDESMVNNFIAYDVDGKQIAWDRWMPDEQTKVLNNIIRRKIAEKKQ